MIIEFIIPTFNREKQLVSMLASLVAQTEDNWLATIVVDDNGSSQYDWKGFRIEKIISKFDTDKIKYIFTGQRWNDYGHTPREMGKQASVADYIIMTGDDNYYVPTFIKELNNVISTSPGMVYWNMIHNGYDYTPFICRVEDGYIDMGAFATRRDLAQQIQLGKEYCADGYYTMNFCKKFPEEKIIKIEKILFIHN